MRNIAIIESSLGELIHFKRLEQSMTLEQLSNIVGIHKGYLSKLENGAIQVPGFRKILAISLGLGISFQDIVEKYIEINPNPEALMEILTEAISQSSPHSLIEQISNKFLESERASTEDSLERLYLFTIGLTDNAYKLTLLQIIIAFADSHSVRPFWAKSLFQYYLLKRDDFEKLRETYEIGKEVLPHARFLSSEEQVTFYYKLGAHAYHLGKYRECIKYCTEVVSLDKTDSALKAYTTDFISFCYYFIGQYDMAEKYIQMLSKFNFPFIQEKVDFMTAKLNGKKGNIDLAVQQLEKCLENHSYKVTVMDDLLELYLKQRNLSSIEKLFQREADFVDVEQNNNPALIAEYANYYAKKSQYFELTQDHKQSFHCLLKSLMMFISVDRYRDATKCIGMLLDKICNHPNILNEDSDILDKLKMAATYLNSHRDEKG
ncbi:helix-turn-helix transcriptional regulator [Paenibacillus thiaminolyticus]|uniref:helix-turn-helix domain-containing protein n=1 Tax=Paenibacillus thiaminolyticus TaxID=49283 RepID=UPI0035A68B97